MKGMWISQDLALTRPREKCEVYTVLADSETLGSSPQHLDGPQSSEGGVCCGTAAPAEGSTGEKEPVAAGSSCC